MSKKLTVDISGCDVSALERQRGEVFPHRFYAAFNSLYREEGDLRKPCPKCENRNVTHLGSFLCSDIWYNVFACEACGVAWCASDQTGGIVERPKVVRDLVRTLYDPDFTPDDEKRNICKNCALWGSVIKLGRAYNCATGRKTYPTNQCSEFTPEEESDSDAE